MNTFGERLRALRNEKEVSMEQMCNEIKATYGASFNKGMISKWENGLVDPKMDHLRTIADYFDVSLDYLLCLSDYKTPKEKLEKTVLNLDPKNDIKTLAAHFEGQEFTQDELDDIQKFINFVISKKKQR